MGVRCKLLCFFLEWALHLVNTQHSLFAKGRGIISCDGCTSLAMPGALNSRGTEYEIQQPLTPTVSPQVVRKVPEGTRASQDVFKRMEI